MNEQKFMSIQEIATTGIMPEHALRTLVKQGKIPHIKIGVKALINYAELITTLNELSKVQ
ncbi:MAG: DNA-binding protein [Clostridia bacterium]